MALLPSERIVIQLLLFSCLESATHLSKQSYGSYLTLKGSREFTYLERADYWIISEAFLVDDYSCATWS